MCDSNKPVDKAPITDQVISFPMHIEKIVKVSVLRVTVLEGEPELNDELYEEIREWAFYKAKAFGEKAGSLKDEFTRDDSLLEHEEDFTILVEYY